MNKFIHIFSVLAILSLFVQPSYSCEWCGIYWVCSWFWDGEEDETKALNSNSEPYLRQPSASYSNLGNSQGGSVKKPDEHGPQGNGTPLNSNSGPYHSPVAVNFNIVRSQDSNVKEAGEQSKSSELELMTLGNVSISMPKKMTRNNTNDGSLSLKLGSYYTLQVFTDYDKASANNTRVKQIHQHGKSTTSKESLTGLFDIFIEEARSRVDDGDYQDSEQFINGIKIVIDSYPENGPFPVKFCENKKKKTSIILFRVDEQAVLLEGPPERTETKTEHKTEPKTEAKPEPK